jgi:uncharacterized membrane protein HdeD (DUF308 family)
MAQSEGVGIRGGFLAGDIRDVLAAIGRHWGWLLTLGILTVLVGVSLLVWPSATVVVIASFLGAYLLVSGIFWIVAAFSAGLAPTGYRWLLGISGVFSVLLGLMAFRSVAQSVAILVLLIGFGFLFQGFAQLLEGIADKGMPGRGWTIFSGIVGILAGFFVLMYPSPSLWALTLVAGIWLIVLGFVEVMGAFRLRRLASV